MSGSNIGVEKSKPLEIEAKTTGRRYKGVLPYRIIGITLLLAIMTVSLYIVMDGESIDADPPSSGDCGGGLHWEYNGSGTITITIIDPTYSGYMTDYTEDSPSPWNAYADQIEIIDITGYTVRIGDYAFYNLSALTTLKITLTTMTTPNLKQFGNHAFDGCKKFHNIKFGDDVKIITDFSNLTSIGNYAFYGCDLQYIQGKDLNIPSKLETIGDHAFEGCYTSTDVHWRSLNFYEWGHPDSSNLSYIGDYAFYGCKFNDLLMIPPTVETIGKYAFAGNSFGYHLYLYDSHATKPTELKSIGDYAFYGCQFTGDVDSPLIIPNSVETIGSHAFEGGYRSGAYHNYPLKLFTGNAGASELKSIGDYAFYGCQFTGDLTIPNKVETIGNYAFSGGQYTGSLKLFEGSAGDSKLKSIGDYVFSGCRFTGSLTVPNKVETIGNYAFSGCEFNGALTLYDNIETIQLKSIGDYAFNGCKFTGSLDIPNTVTTIGKYTFNGCKFTGDLTIPDATKTIGNYAFNECYQSESAVNWKLTLSGATNLISIGDYAFNGCKFTGDVDSQLIIPNSVETIGSHAFSGGQYTGSLKLFKGSAGDSKLKSIGDYAFSECGFTGDLTIPDGVESIGSYAFNKCKFNTTLTIPSKVTTIGDYAFNECEFYDELTIPSKVTTIGSYAFNKCKFYGSLTIPGKVTTIGDYAFSECNFNGTLTLTDSITNIGEYAFNGCDFINSLTLPRDLTSIHNGVFKGCNFTGSLYIPDNVKNIGDEAFLDCDFNGTLHLPIGLISIGSAAFKNCSFVGSLHIPTGVTEIKDETFTECKFTGPLTIPDGVTHIGKFAFQGYECEECDLIVPNSVMSLGDRAFIGCKFNKLIFPIDTATFTGQPPFIDCVFKGGLEINESTSSIPDSLFSSATFGGCLVIPDNVHSIGHFAFMGSTFEGEPGKNHIISDNVNFIGDRCFNECWMKDGYGGLGHLQLSRNVTFFGQFAFLSCHVLIDEIILAPGVVFEGYGYTRQFFEGPGIDKIIVMTTSLPAGFSFNVPTLYLNDGETPIDDYNSDDVYLHIFTNINGHLTQQTDPIITHTVSYNTDGGSKSGPSTSQYYEGEMITIAEYDGTKEGYNFAAWIYNNQIYLPGEKYKMDTSSIEFKAAWEPAYKVRYDVNGGSTKGPETKQYKPGTIVTVQGYGGSKPGYSFNGWNWNGKTYYEGDQITVMNRDIVLNANWTPMYRVTYDINGGSGSAPTQEDLLEGATFTVKSYSGTKTGYLFDGWICDGKVYQAGDTVKMGKKDITLLAVWTMLHSVTYELNGGEGDVPKQSDVAEGYTFTVKACTATMEGHVFKGWSYDRLLFQEGDIITMELDDIVLTATWEKGIQTHKVTYDLQGGSGEAPIQADVPEGSTFIVKAYSGTKEGYKFGGWLYDSNVYMMGATIKMGTKDIVLQAIWSSGEPEDDDSNIRTLLMIAGAAIGGLAAIGGVAFLILRRL